MSCCDDKVRKQDATIAKNYLNEEELSALNNLVEQYLVFAEGQAMRRIPMHMGDWIGKLNDFLTLNDRDILNNAGKVSHEMTKSLAEREYDKFHQHRFHHEAFKAEGEDFAVLEKLEHQLLQRTSEKKGDK